MTVSRLAVFAIAVMLGDGIESRPRFAASSPTIAPHAVQQPATAPTPIFNGRDLTGWAVTPPGAWRVEGGELVRGAASERVAQLETEHEYGDIELRFDYRRAKDATPVVVVRNGTHSFGGAADTWISVRFIQVGERFSAFVDGKRLADGDRLVVPERPGPLPLRAPLSLASRGDVRFRDVTIRQLDSSEATSYLKELGAGFEPVFDGKSFDGWAGPIDNYQIVDGAILCKPGKGGTIYTAREYRDFVARLEFKLPSAGNNGLAIRYPGTGDAAYAGMTELQVLDNTAEKYAGLDPRQFHGSAYGMVPALKGYQRPVGEWNFQEVTVRGATITVDLNGTRILDADLSTVREFMANTPHPGKDRRSGHFGFAGHGDPVQFRHVQIKALP